MHRFFAKHFKPLPSRSTDKERSESLGPDKYVYGKLPSATTVRVLLLAPGNGCDGIYCHLLPCDLDRDDSEEQEHEMTASLRDGVQSDRLSTADNSPHNRTRRYPFQSYTALSYVWGSAKNPAYIAIDGNTRFEVTRNLYDALKCLRKTDQAMPLWVDAICINQNDPEEKRIQIGLMRRIYKQARDVVAYVPQRPEDVEPFIDLVERICIAGKRCKDLIEETESAEQEDDEPIPGGKSFRAQVVPLEPSGTCIEDYDVPPEGDPVWVTWRRFFASTYFRRIWILQEFALAKNLCFHTGFSTLSFPTIALVTEIVTKYSRLMNAQYLGRGENAELTRKACLGWRGLRLMIRERVYAQAGFGNRLIFDIRFAFDFDATDPRDKIYALLGLVSDPEYFQHLVSYQPADSYTAVYIRFAKALIEQGHLVEIMRLACKSPGSMQLPSWVPDWSASPEISSSPNISLDERYRAGGNDTLGARSLIRNQLIINGRVVNKVAFMTSPMRRYSLNAAIGGRAQDVFEMLITALRELSNFFKHSSVDVDKSFFCCVTMHPTTFESRCRNDEGDNSFRRDLSLWQMLCARMSEYQQIKLHSRRKVTFGGLPQQERAFIERVTENLAGRCCCVTEPGNQLGLVSERASVGDRIAIVEGAPVPFVLREAKGSSARRVYNLVGDAFVLDMMQGESVPDKGRKWDMIVLV